MSRVRLIAESAVIGALFSTCFPLALMLREGRAYWGLILFSIALYCSVSILYAAVLHHRLEPLPKIA